MKVRLRLPLTLLSTWRGFVYVAFIIDVFAGYIVGGGSHRPWKRHSCWMHWSRRYGPVDRPARSITVIKVLSMYRWLYTQRLKEAGLLASTGSTGDSYDNAMAESINGLYKAEVIHRKSWKTVQKWNWPHSRGWTGITIDDCWKGWAILLRQKQKSLLCFHRKR